MTFYFLQSPGDNHHDTTQQPYEFSVWLHHDSARGLIKTLRLAITMMSDPSAIIRFSFQASVNQQEKDNSDKRTTI
jgi:hypothetical protein